MRTVTNIEDLRDIHRRKVPRAFFDYCDRGSYDEETLRANREGLRALKFRQRVMVDIDNRDTSTTLLGEKISLPIALAPVGLTGMQHGDGEIHAARAAEKAGVPFCLSTMSICSLEDVASAVEKPIWFQLYVMRNRDFSKSLVERAIEAKCSALVLTLDLQVVGQRHRDIKNGMTVPPRVTLANVLDVATKPGWAIRVLRGKRKTFGNLAGRVAGMEGAKSLAEWTNSQFDPTLDWDDARWIRKLWPGKLIMKGVTDLEDARLAVEAGADAIVVSNHGGRQLDGAPPSIAALPRIADALGKRTEVMFDGGVRSGQDVVRALALGARACMVGRAYIHGLGAGGEAGVTKAIEIIRKEMDITMALTARRSVAEIDRTVLVD